MKKNLISISCLEDIGGWVAFFNGKVIVCGKGSSIDDAKTIGIHEGMLYRLHAPLHQDLVHLRVSLCELWNIRFGQCHYKSFPSMNHMVNCILELKEEHEGVYKGCVLRKNIKKPFGSSDTRSNEILDLILFWYLWTHGRKIFWRSSILCDFHRW